jgi:hypothetical protein
MVLSLRSSGEAQESGIETRSFWSRIQKGNEHDAEMGNLGVNVHKVGFFCWPSVQAD